MRPIRWLGVGFLVTGMLLLLNFFSKRINPDVASGNYGLLALLFGSLLLGADAYVKRVNFAQTRTSSYLPITLGWLMLSSGLLISLFGFLLENQVMCGCPASGSCYCGVLLYNVMFYAGLSVAIVGTSLIVVGTILKRKKTALPEPVIPSQRIADTHFKRNIALAVALTILIVFGLFSYWPGVYITSNYEHKRARTFLTRNGGESQLSNAHDIFYRAVRLRISTANRRKFCLRPAFQ